MPGQNIDKQNAQALSLFKMSPTITSNSSSHQLVSSSEENTNENVEIERVSRTTSVREWIAVIVLCFINLINYMDRFTLAGKFFER